MKSALLLAAVLALSACDSLKSKTAPSSVPVITTFTASPASGKAPLSVTFTVDVSGADHCDLVGIGAVSCNGSKSWIVTASTDFQLVATSANGRQAAQATRVTITP